MNPIISSLFTFSLLSSFLSLSTSSTHAQQCHFPAIFNFGDSNSDTGGLSAAFGQAGPPHGSSFFGSPAGRYCDGRLVIDFIAESLGLPYLSAFLDSVGSNFSHGANFATAGSPIRALNSTLRQSGFSPFSLDVQFVQFYNFHNRSQTVRSRGGVYKTMLPDADSFSQALYTFDMGQNDLTAGYFANKTVEQVETEVPEIISQFKNAIKNIYGQGGRYFWIHNTGPIGCLAYVIEWFPVKASDFDAHGCVSSLNHLAQQFNHALKQAVIELRASLAEAAISYVDVYSVKHELFLHAQGHGFKRSLMSCCGHGGKYNYNKGIGCGMKKTVKGKEIYIGKPCDEPGKAVVWDGVHFTQAANKFIFDKIAPGLSMACHRQ
ncbi:PREDICTED: alpha-L-fucosidase 3-like [Camelina sativa]|uniref:Alpha-L-fucosidase 3-like n=1 Tax=Camelina sativa TaxID=90675 RepID=A0ABM0WGD3_CAMSA|nr:PREDICTED: alpha-L-fucosidase 3-like [Camelina sativa]